jgi:transketolase
MRRTFAEALAEIATNDKRILLLTADLGFMALEPFSSRHPENFFNVGVAEQNMVGVATGLAEAGFIPFVYSISNFATMRPFEFIRNGPVAHKLPVRIVSVGGGFEYGHNGISHFGLEDVGILRTQPGLSIICPCDAQQARTAIQKTWDLPQPIYLRLGKDDRLIVPGLEGRFSIGHADIVHHGEDILLIAMGTAAIEAVKAAQVLHSRGIGATVLLVSSLNPGPDIDVLNHLRRFGHAITVETHYTVGGLGSWVAELATEHAIGTRVIRTGVKSHPGCRSGSQSWMHAQNGLSADALVKTAVDFLSLK